MATFTFTALQAFTPFFMYGEADNLNEHEIATAERFEKRLAELYPGFIITLPYDSDGQLIKDEFALCDLLRMHGECIVFQVHVPDEYEYRLVYVEDIWDEATVEEIDDAYRGHFDFATEVREHLLTEWWDCNEVPEHLISYIDEERVYQNMMFDYIVCDRQHGGGKADYYLFSTC